MFSMLMLTSGTIGSRRQEFTRDEDSAFDEESDTSDDDYV